jgi:hypothetical protein
MSRTRTQDGQATVELVALLPLAALVVAAAWQLVLAGQAVWLAGAAARAGARAHAVGGDAAAAARRVLPARLERGMRVVARDDGSVTVAVPVPGVLGPHRLTTISERARFVPQAS